MKTLAITDISVGDRCRKIAGDIETLAASIERLGLLHPVVVTPDKRLIAGGRRLQAFRHLGRDRIPVRVVRNLDDAIALLEAERDENTCRLDLAPSEAVALGRKLEELEQKAAKGRQRHGGRPSKDGKKRSGKLPDHSTGQTRDKVAPAVGMSGRTYEKAEAVVEAAEAEPEMFRDLVEEMDRTGKVDHAFQQVRRRKQDDRKRQEMREAARKAGRNGKFDPRSIIHGDAVVELPRLPERPRQIFTDPKYNIGVDYGDGEDADRLPESEYLAGVEAWVRLCHDVLADDGSLWVLINWENAARYELLLQAAGFTIRNWITWYETFGTNCSCKFNRCSRRLFYCVKNPERFVFHPEAVSRPSARQVVYNDGRAAEAGKLWDDVWCIPRLPGTAAERIPDFPTQLPLEVLRPIIEVASDRGDLVVDPFSGSATTGAVCLELGRRYLGIEKQKKFVDLSRLRLAAMGAS
jgi:site-specific DNA-methyltransferase (adenine-specific)